MNGTIGKKRNIFAVWLGLPIITLGIYNLVWWYKINREIKDFDHRIEVNPGWAVASLFPGVYLLLIPAIMTTLNTGKRIRQAQVSAGLPGTCSGGLGLLLTILFGLNSLYYQAELNKIWDQYQGAQVPLAAGV
jgi:hypothetical protein